MRRTYHMMLLVIGYFLLSGCTHDRMRYENVLNQAERQNADYDSITNLDSIKMAVKFMDANGTNNERIRAHYLLGCAYRDMGETPLALESYHRAVNSADTTQADCDFGQLVKVHSQMAFLFYQQSLPYEHLEELDLQYRCAIRAGKLLSSINAIEHKAGIYELLDMPDSIIQIRESAYQLYKQNGYEKEAALAIGPIIKILIEKGDLEKAKQYMDIYDAEIGFSEKGMIEKRRAVYYYTKGEYYLAKDKTDSARFFFQKLLDPTLDDEQHEAGYRGLYDLYKKIGQKDSLAKYAYLCYQIKDVIYSSNVPKEIQQMQALYNYTRSQKEASEMKEKADRNRFMLMVALVVLILVLAIGSYIYQKRRKETEILYLQYENTKANLEKAKKEQKKMEEENSSLLEEKNKEILLYEQQIRGYEAQMKNERMNTQIASKEMKQKIADITDQEVAKVRRGVALYESIQENQTARHWPSEDYEAFIAYYDAINHDLLERIHHDYGKLTAQNIFFLLLKDMGKTRQELSEILGISMDSLRSTESRIRNKKKDIT